MFVFPNFTFQKKTSVLCQTKTWKVFCLVPSRRGCGGALHDWIPHQEAGQVSRLSRLRLWRLLLLLLLRIQSRLLLLVEPSLLLLLLVLLMRAVVEVVLVGGRGYGQRVQGRTVVVTNTCHEEM